MKQKIVLITGAARGIGYITGQRFLEEGARVIFTDHDIKALRTAVTESTGRETPIAMKLDVTDPKSLTTVLERIKREYGRIDILINNAGVVRDAQLIKMSTEDFDAVIAINLKGVYQCTQAIAQVMIEQRQGVILNNASIVGLYGNFGQTNYAASKAGVIAMTKVWAKELGPQGIRVNAVAPGFIHTRLTENIPETVQQKLLQRISLKRFGEALDIANAFLWLASDDAKYVHGHVLSVDGGTVL